MKSTATESPPEICFLDDVEYLLPGSVSITPQVWIDTDAGRFRLDFVLASKQRAVGIEIDGKAYHNHERDHERDSAILRTRRVALIYRFSAADALYRGSTVLYFLAYREPTFFGDRLCRHLGGRILAWERKALKRKLYIGGRLHADDPDCPSRPRTVLVGVSISRPQKQEPTP